MFTVHEKIDRTLILTIRNPKEPSKGHPIKRGAGTHSDKRIRRTNRRSRNTNAINEFDA